jgi:hypothetical protein
MISRLGVLDLPFRGHPADASGLSQRLSYVQGVEFAWINTTIEASLFETFRILHERLIAQRPTSPMHPDTPLRLHELMNLHGVIWGGMERRKYTPR